MQRYYFAAEEMNKENAKVSYDKLYASVVTNGNKILLDNAIEFGATFTSDGWTGQDGVPVRAVPSAAVPLAARPSFLRPSNGREAR